MSERNVEREEEEGRGEDFERKIRGEHARGKNIPGVVSLASVEAGEVAHSAVERGGVKGVCSGTERESTRPEKDEAAWSRLARSRPSAQQKRDKSSTLIRILPLFALWNTILNGMGAQ